MSKPVILTGLRANNDLHIGNYFGALLPMIDMAKQHAGKYQIHLFVPDLHSFTTPIDHSELKAQIAHNLKLFVAAGLPLNNADVHIYRQSYVPAHSELTIILNSFTGFGEMGRMTQFKDKVSKESVERISVGLYDYPVLMAADILLYNADYVPVGEDQAQHLEFTRDIAERMNSKFNSELFVVPHEVKKQHEFFGKDQGLRIKDLSDPTRKMSKSEETGKGIIFLGDAPELAHKKVMGATTDSAGTISYDPLNQPGISNLLQILGLLRNQSVEDAAHHFRGQSSYGDFKKEIADEVARFLEDFQKRMESISDTEIQSKLDVSEARMNEIANETLLRVQKAAGLR